MRKFCKRNRVAGSVAAAACLAMIPAATAGAETGGIDPDGSSNTTGTVPGAKAKINGAGQAIAPASAPRKVKRVIEKQSPVDEVLLVLDATTGQNGMRQAEVFSQVVGITGIVLTKLDGTAKGGIVISVQRELGVPVKLIGLGEGADDLAPFEPESFVDALLGEPALATAGGCRFRPRCPLAFERCAAEDPPLRIVAPGHAAACHLA